MNDAKIIFFPERSIKEAASRYRVYQLAEKLLNYDIDIEIIESPFGHSLYYSRYGAFKKAYLHLINNVRSLRGILSARKDDVLIFQRGEWHRGKALQIKFFKKIDDKNIVFDLDDAIFLGNKEVDKIFSTVDVVFVGSHYLKRHVEKFNDNVYLIPTGVDTTKYGIKTHVSKDEVSIGWIGSPSTAKYLKLLEKPLEILGENYKIRFIVIGCREDQVPRIHNVKVISKKWSLQTEWLDLKEFDIGVMPLYDGPWEKGKCAFKAIQYMTLGIPAVCSSVGEINYIINHGENGYLCSDLDDWVRHIEKLIVSHKLRNKIGIKGRITVESRFDLSKIAKNVYEILKSEFGI